MRIRPDKFGDDAGYRDGLCGRAVVAGSVMRQKRGTGHQKRGDGSCKALHTLTSQLKSRAARSVKLYYGRTRKVAAQADEIQRLLRYNCPCAGKAKCWRLEIVTSTAVRLIGASPTGASAQWLNFPTPGIPRTRDGKPKPVRAHAAHCRWEAADLSGVWMHEGTSVSELKRLYGDTRVNEALATQAPGMEIDLESKYAFNILTDIDPEASPLRPEAAEIMRRRNAEYDPSDPCSEFISFPLAGLLSEPIKIIQAPRLTAILYEVGNLHRQIFTDGRALPKQFEFPAYLGYSVGHWDRDIFVVETAGFNDKAPLDDMEHRRSVELRVTERFHRRDFGHLDVEMTFDDPKMYTKPFTIKVPHTLMADADIFEMVCNENEKDAVHIQQH